MKKRKIDALNELSKRLDKTLKKSWNSWRKL